MSGDDVRIREATVSDMETIIRHRGLAKSIMNAMIRWCREQGFGCVSLHASDAGRHLYESMGFKPTNEMRLGIDK
ncbi:MAG: hypothetical protein COT43_10080 [Candidatus Marinimicrobia bacterium CG08_land_8_20_14_0_20_45_22]|nr:MAG: hypothetical protein COT43_10080 [Candidatus Marinimicrobia bacterium CG08_land_8_20_14_0_20_45_22]